MNETFRKFNWLKVVLATVTAIALSLLYSLIYKSDTNNSFLALIQNLLPNLIAVLISIPIIYLIFTKIGLSPEEELRQGIVEDINKLNTYQSGFVDYDKIMDAADFISKLKSAKTLDIVALSGINIISTYRKELVEIVQNGCEVRIIIIDPDSEAAKVVMENQRHKELIPDLNRLIDRVKTTIVEADSIQHNGSIKVRGINWIPSCALIIYNREHAESEIRVKVYPVMIDIPIGTIISNTIVYKKYEPKLAKYFISNYEDLWTRSTEII